MILIDTRATGSLRSCRPKSYFGRSLEVERWASSTRLASALESLPGFESKSFNLTASALSVLTHDIDLTITIVCAPQSEASFSRLGLFRLNQRYGCPKRAGRDPSQADRARVSDEIIFQMDCLHKLSRHEMPIVNLPTAIEKAVKYYALALPSEHYISVYTSSGYVCSFLDVEL